MTKYSLMITAGLVLAAGACSTGPVANLNQVNPGTAPAGYQARFLGMLYYQRQDYGDRTVMFASFARDGGNFTTTDTRFDTEWLGDGQAIEPGTFFGASSEESQMSAIRQSEGILADLPNAVPAYSAGDIAKWKGMIYTIDALAYMNIAVPHDTLGFPMASATTATPSVQTPILCAKDMWQQIVALLDSGLTQLNVDQSPGLPMPLPPGFSLVSAQASPSTALGSFAAFNRALAVRANLELAYAIARSPGGTPPTPTAPGSPDHAALLRADSALHASALYSSTNLAPPVAGGFNDALAVYEDFSGQSGDLPNQYLLAYQTTFYVLKEAMADIDPADKRLVKIIPAAGAAGTAYGLVASPNTVGMYPQSNSPMPIIRNEELNLFEAQIRLGLGDIPGAINAINAVRVNVGGLPALSAAGQTYVSVRNQILKELRASTIAEPGGDRVAALRDYGLPAMADTTWGTKDTHATVETLSVSDAEGRPNTHYTCP
jgi:hypothetical protein